MDDHTIIHLKSGTAVTQDERGTALRLGDKTTYTQNAFEAELLHRLAQQELCLTACFSDSSVQNSLDMAAFILTFGDYIEVL